ncbi:hypothetical protein [Streptomyces anulatus]|uniref:hypothetical protein n=1 Tax=Streptomyces anulatus TaxID=1892 RepID=UPI001C262077|nr:hypothetical protein [Streptomyces anulatus]
MPALTELERSLHRHLVDGGNLGGLGPALGMSQKEASILYTGMCDLLGSPRNPAALVAICYALGAVQPPELLDPSGIALPQEERDLLPLFAIGLSAADMAAQLDRKQWKVNEQAKEVLDNLQAKTRAQAVHVAWQYGIVTGPAIREWLETGDPAGTKTTAPLSGLGPVLYIQTREGEVADTPRALCAARGPAEAMALLAYWDQAADDRDERGALWARASEVLSRSGRPVGQPVPGVHPARQPDTMRRQRCRLCFGHARLELPRKPGYLYLVTDNERRPQGGYRTTEPPVCIDHALVCADSEPRLQSGHTALLVTSSTESGVLGTRYVPLGDSANVAAVSESQGFHPYADRERMRWVLASALVRDLTAYKIIDLRRLIRSTFPTPSAPASRRPFATA